MKLDFYSIVIAENEISENGYVKLAESAKKHNILFPIKIFDAVVPSNVQSIMDFYGLYWNYPEDDIPRLDPSTGLLKSPYKTSSVLAKRACAVSHFCLWDQCDKTGIPIVILEHDAVFIRDLDIDLLLNSPKQIIGLNDPTGATRKARTFDSIVKKGKTPIVDIPIIDAPHIPQGLAGASAYLIKPNGAHEAIRLVKKYGLWHNDAILCRQLLPGMMGVTRTYYTKVQGIKSTST